MSEIVGESVNRYETPMLMKAIRYTKPEEFTLVTLPVPHPGPNEILIKVKSCGICGSDLHIHSGELETRMPVITGHETSGIVVKMGSSVTGFQIGNKVTADNSEPCGHCHYCRQGKPLYCENFAAHGLHLDGGFAEYCVFPAEKLFRFEKLSWKEATLFEAASCAVHGIERIKPAVGSTVLFIGSGPTGLCLSQLLKNNGGQHVVLASNKGRKMDLAKKLNAADQYVELDRENPETQWQSLQAQFPHGFDVVIEATGSIAILQQAIHFCTRGGTLLYYGVYAKEALIQVSPSKVFMDEITMLGSHSQMWCMSQSVKYLESRKVDVRGIVDRTFNLENFGEALDAVRKKECVKAAIIFE